MTFMRVRRHALACAALITLVLPMSAAIAADQRDGDRDNRQGHHPVTIPFTKWRVNIPADATQPPFHFDGVANGLATDTFVAEVLQRQTATFAKFRNKLTRLEAVYEVRTEACLAFPEICGQGGDRSFTALVRGGQDAAASGRLDGVVLAGWRTGAPVHVVFERHLPASSTDVACTGAPMGTACFEGTLEIGSVEKD